MQMGCLRGSRESRQVLSPRSTTKHNTFRLTRLNQFTRTKIQITAYTGFVDKLCYYTGKVISYSPIYSSHSGRRRGFPGDLWLKTLSTRVFREMFLLTLFKKRT